MGMVVVVCAALGLTVSDVKTEIMCLRTKESTASFRYRQRVRCTAKRTSSYASGGTSTTMLTCPPRSIGAYPTHGAASGSTPSNCTTDRALPSSSKSGCSEPRYSNNTVRLRHVEATRVSLRHAAPSPSQLLDSLHQLAKEQSRHPPDFLSGHAYQDGKLEHRGDFKQEADLIRGVCCAHGGYESADVRDAQRIGGGRELRGGPGKRVDAAFPGRSQSLRHQRRLVDDCSPGHEGMAQDGGRRGGTFHGKMDRCRESQGWTTACSSMPERDGKDQGVASTPLPKGRAESLGNMI